MHHLNRCCRDSIRWLNLNWPAEGVEIPCRWCSGYVRYTQGEWIYHESSLKPVLPTAPEAQP